MNVIEETVAEFGRSMGMQNLRLRANGCLVLALQSVGTLAIDVAGPQQDSVVVSLSKSVSRSAEPDSRRLLSLAHYRSRSPLPVQFGAAHGQVVLAVVLPQEEFTLTKINEVIRLLDRQHQSMEAGV
jgi:type III secretion system chaperone SycN